MAKNDCPRCHKEPAIVDVSFGVLPGEKCQAADARFSLRGRSGPEFTSLARMSRVQLQRDHHGKDLIQPFDRNRPNPEFVKAYPEKAKTYFTKDELSKF